MGMTGFGEGPLPPSLPSGGFGGDQPQKLHQLSGVIKPREIAEFRHGGDSHRALHTTQGLQCIDDRVSTPGLDLLVEFLVKTLEACGVFGHRADICLQDDVLRRGGTDDLGEPSEVGQAPIGWAGGADIVAQQASLETELGVLQSAENSFTRTREIAYGFLCDLGDIDWGESP
jgi:hypothetical protein